MSALPSSIFWSSRFKIWPTPLRERGSPIVAAQTIEHLQPSGFRKRAHSVESGWPSWKGVEADSEVGEVPGEADALEVRVERPLRDLVVRQGVDDLRRDLLALREVDDLHLAAVDRVAEQQDLESR